MQATERSRRGTPEDVRASRRRCQRFVPGWARGHVRLPTRHEHRAYSLYCFAVWKATKTLEVSQW